MYAESRSANTRCVTKEWIRNRSIELPPKSLTGDAIDLVPGSEIVPTQAIQSEAYAVLVVVGDVILYA